MARWRDGSDEVAAKTVPFGGDLGGQGRRERWHWILLGAGFKTAYTLVALEQHIDDHGLVKEAAKMVRGRSFADVLPVISVVDGGIGDVFGFLSVWASKRRIIY